MKKLIHKDIKPIGGYKFTDPDTGYGYTLNYKTFGELEDHVNRYRTNNKLLPIENFRAVWEAYVCANEPLMVGRCCDVEEKIKRGFEQYWNGAKAFVRTVIKKAGFCSEEEATARAEKCSRCTQNVKNIGHSHSQYYTDAYMRKQVGHRRTKFDDRLYTCKVCTCILKAKVHYASDTVAKSLSDSELGRLAREPRDIKTSKPLRCWQLDCALKDSSDE